MVMVILPRVREVSSTYLACARSSQNNSLSGEVVERAVDRYDVAFQLPSYFVHGERTFRMPEDLKKSHPLWRSAEAMLMEQVPKVRLCA